MVDGDQLVELVADALGRHDLEAVVHRVDGGDQLGDGLQVVAGDEAGGAQHPQRVVAEADTSGVSGVRSVRVSEVGGAAERVDERRASAR